MDNVCITHCSLMGYGTCSVTEGYQRFGEQTHIAITFRWNHLQDYQGYQDLEHHNTKFRCRRNPNYYANPTKYCIHRIKNLYFCYRMWEIARKMHNLDPITRHFQLLCTNMHIIILFYSLKCCFRVPMIPKEEACKINGREVDEWRKNSH
jgi:hypothetical protein